MTRGPERGREREREGDGGTEGRRETDDAGSGFLRSSGRGPRAGLLRRSPADILPRGEASRGVLAAVEDERVPACRYFASSITTVEIVHAGRLVPHFFADPKAPKASSGCNTEIPWRRSDE